MFYTFMYRTEMFCGIVNIVSHFSAVQTRRTLNRKKNYAKLSKKKVT